MLTQKYFDQILVHVNLHQPAILVHVNLHQSGYFTDLLWRYG